MDHVIVRTNEVEVKNKIEIDKKIIDKMKEELDEELKEICTGKIKDTKQEIKELLSKLAVVVNLESGEIINITDKSSTGKTYEECVQSFAKYLDKILINSEKESKIEGNCGDDVLCRD